MLATPCSELVVAPTMCVSPNTQQSLDEETPVSHPEDTA